MGLLQDLREKAAKINPQSLITEDKERAAALFREQMINDGARLFDETYSRYTGLGNLLESADPREQWKAALTLNMLAKTEALSRTASKSTVRRWSRARWAHSRLACWTWFVSSIRTKS
jgi:hypothetical protein